MRRFVVLGLAAGLLAAPAVAAGSPELSTSDQLNTRRYVAAGERAYVMGFQDGGFGAQGWHVTGEMGGVWSQPLKLVDGVWFGVGDAWLRARDELHQRVGLHADGVPGRERAEGQPHRPRPRHGARARCSGCGCENPSGAAKTVQVKVDAHSEVMSHYPWAWTTPNAGDCERAPTPARTRTATLVFADTRRASARTRGRSRGEAGAGPHRPGDRAGAVRGREPVLLRRGPVRQGHGRAAALPRDRPGARRADAVGRRPARARGGACARRSPIRRARCARSRRRATRWARYSQLALPGRPAAGRRDRVGQAEPARPHAARGQPADPRRRRGQAVPGRRSGPSRSARWIGAGYPDYPWIFATDAEYTAFASVAAGQFEAIEDHARALRDVSVILNGAVGQGRARDRRRRVGVLRLLKHAGNTDETAKFPSLVALLWRWTGDDQRPLSVRGAQHALRHRRSSTPTATAGPRASATSSGRAWATRSSTTPSTRSAGSTTSRTWRAPSTTGAPPRGRAARPASSSRRFEAAWWRATAGQYFDSLQTRHVQSSRSTGSARRRWRPS